MATFGSAQEALLERIISEAGQSDTTPEDLNYLGTTLLEIGGTLPSAPPSEMYSAQQALLNRIQVVAANPLATPEEISYLGTTLQLMSTTVLVNEFQTVRDNGVTLITGAVNQAVFDVEKLKAETLAYIEAVRLETQQVDQAVATTLGYRDATLTARNAVFTARGETYTARDAALSSETKAKTSETNAKTSETNTAASKDRAVQAETAADGYRGAAQSARDAALNARDAALASQTAAAASARSAAENDATAVIDGHMTNTGNPHATTAAQVGAFSKVEADSRFATAGHSHTADAVGAFSKAEADSRFATAGHSHQAAAVGAYTKSEIDTKLVTKAETVNPIFSGSNSTTDGTAGNFSTTTAPNVAVNFIVSGVVQGTLSASVSAMAFNTGPGGKTLTLNDSGYMSWSGNRFTLSGDAPGFELTDTSYSSTPGVLYHNDGYLGWVTPLKGQVFIINPDGFVNATGFAASAGSGQGSALQGVAVTGNGVYGSSSGNSAVYGTSSGGHGVHGISSSHHAILGQTTGTGQAGVVGISRQNTFAGYLGLEGWGVYAAGPTYSSGGYQSSDERLKRDIVDAPVADVLDRLRQLRVVEFDWRENTEAYIAGKRRMLGLIAQEVQEVLPGLVMPVTAPGVIPPTPGDEGPMPLPKQTLNQELGEFLSLDSGPLIYYLLAAVQKLAEIVDPLATRTSKYHMFERMTDTEVGTFDQIMAQQTRKKQHLFDQCSYLDHADPFFQELKMVMSQVWSPARAAEVLVADEA